MTNKYLIHIIKSDMTLKVTYRNKRIITVTHQLGKFDEFVINHLGALLPVYEKDIPIKEQEYLGKVTYTLEVKQKSLYTLFLDEWYRFYEKTTGVPPKFTGADGKALKQVIAYLKQINNANETVALQNWQLILTKWETLKEFHQDNTDLKYINSRLNVIIREIIKNNGASTTRTGRSVSI